MVGTGTRQTQRIIWLAAAIVSSVVCCGGQSTHGGNGDPGDASVPSPGPDGLSDASLPDPSLPSCSRIHEVVSIVDTFAIEDGASGFDLDGDGDIDNGFGSSESRDDINSLLAMSLEDGFRLAIELQELDDPQLLDDSRLSMVFREVEDLDCPKNPNDDFSGGEPFGFDANDPGADGCGAIARLTASLDSGHLGGAADALDLLFGGLGTFPLIETRFEADIVPSGLGFRITEGRLGGIVTACSLYEMEPVGDFSPLWLVAHYFDLQPDMDLDGDGLETITTSTEKGIVERCIDPRGHDNPDPVTIEGENCACAEGMADGYSMLLILTSVGATLQGPLPGQPGCDTSS